MSDVGELIGAIEIVDTALQDTSGVEVDLARAMVIVKSLDAAGYEIVHRKPKADDDG